MVVRNGLRREQEAKQRQHAAEKATTRSTNKLMFWVAVVGVVATVAGVLVEWLT